jgi:hypothetical protein
VIGRQFVADVGFVRAGRCLANAAITDRLAARLQGHGELKLAARLLGLLIDEHLYETLHVFRCAIRPLVVSQMTRIALIG